MALRLLIAHLLLLLRHRRHLLRRPLRRLHHHHLRLSPFRGAPALRPRSAAVTGAARIWSFLGRTSTEGITRLRRTSTATGTGALVRPAPRRRFARAAPER